MAKPVEENYLITIKGTMEQNGENDTVELMTRGNFVQRGNSYYIVYAETEATGYAGCTTTVRVSQDARLVSMTRFGKTSSQLSTTCCRMAASCSSATRWIPAPKP